VARAYGVFHEEAGAALRATFVIDKQGVVTYKVVNPIGEARDHSDARKALASLG
jgi:peroxiredoxin (alkyl hydroperoxide reductase subunit C)